MNEEELVNLNMKSVILDKWKSKLSYPFNLKDLEELENIIDYYAEENQSLKKQLTTYQILKSYVASILCENDELQQENQKYKEVIDKVSSQIKLYGKYNGEKCTRGFSVMTADFNKLLEILKEVE